jgi:multidrug efflux pump subunit AcrA (membrane-fusion protein)
MTQQNGRPMTQQDENQDSKRGTWVEVAPERLVSDNYLSVQVLEGMPNLLARGVIYASLLLFLVGLAYASVVRMHLTVRCPGVVQPEHVRRLFAHQSGIVEEVSCSPGQFVRKGQELARLDLPGGADRTDGGRESIVADADGRVLELSFRHPGQVVREGDLLCTLQPDDSGLKVEMRVPNKDVGRIAAGMPVLLKLDAFPAADFGVVRTRVSEIGPTARSEAQESFYEVSAVLPQGYVEKRGTRVPIRPGMTATAEIVVAERSLLSAMVGRISQ